MAQANLEDYEILCILCGKCIDEEQVHIVAASPLAADFDVLCPECFERFRNAQQAPPAILDCQDENP